MVMPFKSKAQQRMMFATMPKLAKRFAADTPNFAVLPNKLKKKQPKRRKGEERGEKSDAGEHEYRD